MKNTIRCTRVQEKPWVKDNIELKPEIESCPECKEDIWVTQMSREARSYLGGGDTVILLCKDCCDAQMEKHLKTSNEAEVVRITPTKEDFIITKYKGNKD